MKITTNVTIKNIHKCFFLTNYSVAG